TENGTRSWRINAWEWTGEKLLLGASRRMGAERPLIELIPRAAASALAAIVRAARQIRCEQIAALACALLPGAKIERAVLSPGVRRGQPGRYARILLNLRNQRVAVTAVAASTYTKDVDAFLSAALLWLARTEARIRPPYIQKLWLILESDAIKPALDRIALLRQGLRQMIVLYEIGNVGQNIRPVEIPARAELWKGKLARFPPVSEPQTSAIASVIKEQFPDAVDVVQARHGETLRYFGLPFARVRRLMDQERVWFGTE